MNPNLKYFFSVGVGGGGARVSDLFLSKNPNIKKRKIWGGGLGGGGEGVLE